MSKHIHLLGFLFSFLIFSGPSFAAVDDGTRLSAEVMTPLINWVANATHVAIKAPPIVTASGRTLKTALGLEGEQQERAMAAYLPGQIIINNIIWDPESLRAQSYIVHELVHHAQLLSGRAYPCHNAKEREAYTLQNKWLEEHGEEPIVTEAWINRMSACGSSDGKSLAMNESQ